MFFKSKKQVQLSVPAIVQALPDRVPIRSLLQLEHDPSGWCRLDIGVDPGGRARGITDRRNGPHTLITGTPGSGKTCALRMIAVQALNRGHEVIVIDPVKGFVDYPQLKPWLKFSAAGDVEAAELIEQVWHEVERRFQVMRTHAKGFWADLDAMVREREQVRPLTVIIDELVEFRLMPTEATAKLWVYVGSIAKQGRAAGVHLVVGTQRPHPEYLGSELRVNLGSNTVLTVWPGSVPDVYTLRGMFGPLAEGAAELARRWNDEARGFALIGSSGSGTVSAVRVGFDSWDDIPAILEEHQIPRVSPGFPESVPDAEDERS